jgi:hypothetical protein
MAVTGKTAIVVTPGPRKGGPKVLRVQEASAQTYPAGAILSKSAGSIVFHGTSYLSVNLYGVALKSGLNLTADGLKSNAIFRFEEDKPFKAAVSGSLAASQLGATCAISQDTAGNVKLVTAAAASDSSAARIVEFAEGFVAGDTNPVVFFVPLRDKIQEG